MQNKKIIKLVELILAAFLNLWCLFSIIVVYLKLDADILYFQYLFLYHIFEKYGLILTIILNLLITSFPIIALIMNKKKIHIGIHIYLFVSSLIFNFFTYSLYDFVQNFSFFTPS